MSAETYTLRIVSAPGRSFDREGITRADLAGALHAAATGLELTDTQLTRLTVEVVAPTPAPVYDHAVELYDELAVEDLQPEIEALERGGDDAAH